MKNVRKVAGHFSVDGKASGPDNLYMRIDVKTHPDLYKLIAEEADRQEISMGRFLVRLAAKFFKRPQLARGRGRGRPRKRQFLPG